MHHGDPTTGRPDPSTDEVRPIPPAQRRQLQQRYEHGCRAADAKQFTAASEMFAGCLASDPGNVVYAQALLEALKAKYTSVDKRGKLARLKAFAMQAALQRARNQGDHQARLRLAIDLVRNNPWDRAGLIALAEICQARQAEEGQLFYLAAALAASPDDPQLNRLTGQALAETGRFEQALDCWRQVAQADASDEEAQAMIRLLRPPEPTADSQAVEHRLRTAIANDPTQLANYLELADLLDQQACHAKSLQALVQATASTGAGDLAIVERQENCRIRLAEQQIQIAQRLLEITDSQATARLVARLVAERDRVELDVYAAQSGRQPEDARLQHEVGVRLKRLGQFSQALGPLRQAVESESCKAIACIELGECLQHLRQFSAAVSSYEQALQAAVPKSDLQKLALYRAGVLAMGLEAWDSAQSHLTELTTLEPGYRDVAERLDKLCEISKKE